MGSLGRRYARAILSLAREERRLDETGEELATLSTVFGDPQLAAVIANPILEGKGRRDLVDQVLAAAGVSTTVANLVRLLAERERLPQLPDIVRSYQALVDRELGRVRVGIRSATPLSAEVQQEVSALARRLAGKEIVVTSGVEPQLLGGVVLDVGGTVYDGSVQTRLAHMSKAMIQDGN